jgi:hypothetical protein
MKMIKHFVLLFFGLFLLLGCGKPNDPESIVPDDISGGYKIVAKYATPGYAQDLIKKDSLLYIAQGEGGLLIVNVKDPGNPELVSVTTENVRGYSAKIAIKDSVVYLAAGTFGITVVDAADPAAPYVTVSNLGMKPARTMLLLGNFMFTAVSEQGVKIAEISYPTQPDVRGGLYTVGYAYGLDNSSDSSWLFVACGEMGFAIYNISDFQEGFGDYPLISWCDTPGDAEAVTVVNSDSLAYLACGTGGLQIIDYSDTSNVNIIGSYLSGGYAKELVYSNQRIYMTTETLGLQIIDVSDPTEPSRIGLVDTEFALGLDKDDKYIYLADEDEGLIIISIPE